MKEYTNGGANGNPGVSSPSKPYSNASDIMARTMTLSGLDSLLVKNGRAVWECYLDAYKYLNLISQSEHRAGLRFRQAYYCAVLSPYAAYERLNSRPVTINLTTSERLLKDAYKKLSPYNRAAIIDICGHNQPARNMDALEKLRRGLGHLAVAWHSAAIEVAEHKIKPPQP
jgi:hypothetical protein